MSRPFLPFEAREENLSLSLCQHIPVHMDSFSSLIKWSAAEFTGAQHELPAVRLLDIHLHWASIIWNEEHSFPARAVPQGMHLSSHPSSNLSQYLLEPVVLLTVGTIPAVAIPIWHYRVLIAEPAVHCHVCGLLPVREGNVSGMSTEFRWCRGKQCLSKRKMQERLE